jgi:hypothetical protein
MPQLTNTQPALTAYAEQCTVRAPSGAPKTRDG